MTNSPEKKPKILILATLSGGYAGANAVGQLHSDYPVNTYVLPVMCPSMFPPEFYLRSFEQGIDGIIVMYSGTDSPFKGGPERTAQLVNQTYPLMKDHGIDTRRLKLAAICTVCTKPFIKEVNQMDELLGGIGFAKDEFKAVAADAHPVA
ncbi:MAG: hydrogenase iron-sulfur subunit [Chloroflexi bacterium]|nr:hydrogenase iron-sulfur subunit [Chloroflexota bacterium]MBL7163742.1 hydrogenase iron-sulfur subunit [Anaerolineales bacterium]